MKYMVEAHIDSAVVRGLRRRGIDAVTTYEAGLHPAPDAEILRVATAQGRIIVTSDADFLALHRFTHHAGIVRIARTRSIGAIIEVLLLIHDVMEPGDMENQVEYW